MFYDKQQPHSPPVHIIVPMKAFLQILGTDTLDTSPTLFVFFDDHRCVTIFLMISIVVSDGGCICAMYFSYTLHNLRYLFNVGEGTQRFCLEHKVRLSRISNLFITRGTWKNMGGLPGTYWCVCGVWML